MEYRKIENPKGGPVLGVTTVGVIEQDGYFFRDMEGTGELLPYEDWRLTPEERAADLAGRLTVEEMAGLMTSHRFMMSSAHLRRRILRSVLSRARSATVIQQKPGTGR